MTRNDSCITRSVWLKLTKNCKWKFIDGGKYPRYEYDAGPHGHVFCGYYMPISFRCMFKKCPLVKPTDKE